MKNELTIVIPCKNEEKYIGKLLNSLEEQTYPMKDVEIIIADANSTDNTVKIIQGYTNKLNIKVIPGGLPAIGRNLGAKHSNSKYILFVDADVILGCNTLIQNSVDTANKKNLNLLTVPLYCLSKNRLAKMLYAVTNLFVRISKYVNMPFVTGMYFFTKRDEYDRLGGFPEDTVFAEDYALSKKMKGSKFKVIPGNIQITDRRFKTTGYIEMVVLFLTTIFFPLKTKFRFDYWDKEHE
jgi:glycosyltransferase involved in cell wall biosynthesis